MPTLSPGG